MRILIGRMRFVGAVPLRASARILYQSHRNAILIRLVEDRATICRCRRPSKGSQFFGIRAGGQTGMLHLARRGQ
jgi:hypothetical protein